MAAGKPGQLMLIPAWWWVISARTYLDRLSNAPDLVANAPKSNVPSYSSAVTKSRWKTIQPNASKKTAPALRIVIVPNCDHFYVGAEDEFEDRNGLVKKRLR